MFQFEISDLIIDIDCDDVKIVERLSKFMLNRYKNSDLNITLQCVDSIEVPDGHVISDESITWMTKPKEQKGYYIYGTEKEYGRILSLLNIDSEWKNGIITYVKTDREPESNYKIVAEAYSHILIGVFFRYALFRYDGMVIHASTLEYNNKGILFSAPSGTGKSTHVKLWQKYIGDEVTVLNDDTPAVRMIGGKPFVYGTPWSGSSNTHCNSSAPLHAVVLLEQASENSIKKIDTQEAIMRLMPRFFLPYFDKNMMCVTMSIFEKILYSVPVFLLSCRPDKEAVELVYEWVM